MSHYTRCKTKLSDHQSLLKALADLGLKGVRYNEVPQQLEGYQGDKREQTAEIIIPRSSVGMSSNDIGFKRAEDGTYEAIISDYDKRRYSQEWLKKLNQRYSYQKVTKELEDMGYEVGEVVTENGKIKLHCVDAYGG